MKTTTTKRNLFCAFIAICFIFASALAHTVLRTTVYAMGEDGYLSQEEIIQENALTQAEFQSISMLSGGGRSDNAGIISGTDTATLSAGDLTRVKYISNANYFLINPWHHDNNTSTGLNVGGVCTTVSLQMLMGYHNYYSDRRIIPTTGNSRTFLGANYGDLAGNPALQRGITNGQGCQQIGTTDDFFHELYDAMLWPDFPGLGQAIGYVKDTGIEFMNEYTPQAVRNNISLTSGIFSKSIAESDIDADRPIVLGMHPFNKEGSFHVVPAYGYAQLDGVDGFLVHWGWGADQTQVWVPSSWFAFQIRMSVEHAHNLIDTGVNVNDTHRRLDCATCGYSTLDNLYNISGPTINGIRYPLTNSITIPNSIDIYSENTASFTTQSITSIGDYAFGDQTQITQINLPNTITNIGDNAFANCTNLTSITGLNNVTSIGANAFKGCSALTSINIPSSTTSIGEGAFKGCNNLNISVNSNNPNYSAQNNILYNKNKTEILASGDISASVTIPTTVTHIEDYAFEGNDNLITLTIQHSPNIGSYAFANCESLSEVYMDSYVVPTMGSEAFLGNEFTLYVPRSKGYDYQLEFFNYTQNIQSIEIEITIVNDTQEPYTLQTYYGATINGLDVPCKPIDNEGYEFEGWYDDESFTGLEYSNGDIWDTKEDITIYAKYNPKNFNINFQENGEYIFEPIIVVFDSEIQNMPILEDRTGQTFIGWINSNGNYYENGDIWKGYGDIVLTPYYSYNIYTITFDGNAGQSRQDSLDIMYSSVIDSLPIADLEGHTFSSWNTVADGTGEVIIAPYTYLFDENITLYAQYVANDYTVTFDKQDGTGGADGVDATFGQDMPTGENITAPTKEGYAFGGYYQSAGGLGIKYYNSDMTSSYVWSIDEPTNIFAYWVANEYEVYLGADFGSEFTSMSSSDIVYIYFTPSSSGAITLTTSHTGGDPYLHLYDAGYNQIAFNDDGNGNFDSKITYNVTSGDGYIVGFRAYSSQTKGSVHYEGVEFSYTYPIYERVATFGEVMPAMSNTTAPLKTGYIFSGYHTKINGQGTKFYNSDMLSVNNWNIANDTILYPYFKADTYTVTLNKEGGSGGPVSVEATYDQKMPSDVAVPEKTGYNFNGYFSGKNGSGTQYYCDNMKSANNWNVADDTTIYACWVPKTFTVILDSDINSGTASVEATYGKAMPESDITPPIREGYIFKGYYEIVNGVDVYYYNADMESVKDWEKAEDCELIAKWIKIYTIKLYNYTPNGNATPSSYYLYDTYEYTIESEDFYLEYVYSDYYDFNGWYSGENGSGTMYSSISQGSTGDKVLYAKWSMVVITLLETHRHYEQDGDYKIPSNPSRDNLAMLHVGHDVTIKNSVTLIAEDYSGYTFKNWTLTGPDSRFDTLSDENYVVFANGSHNGVVVNNNKITVTFDYMLEIQWNSDYYLPQFVANYQANECIAEGTLITLADGTQKAVEDLDGTEQLLVWNMLTGQFDTAPILFIDSDPRQKYEVIRLKFADGTKVDVIDEHGFYNMTLNEYVFLDENASQYIGHMFNKQTLDENGNMVWKSVKLKKVKIINKKTTAYSPVTYSHLCYYVNGMLSMPGATTGLINIFEVNPETVTIDQAQMQADIETYGLFTYEEFYELYPIPEEVFNAFNGEYLKVSIGKGLITHEELGQLIESYSEFFVS